MNQPPTIPTGEMSTPRVPQLITSLSTAIRRAAPLCFRAGSVFWSWGLSDQHDNSPGSYSSQSTDPNVQQSMVNLLADIGESLTANAAGEPCHCQPIDRHDAAHIHHLHRFEHEYHRGSNGNGHRHSDRYGRRCHWRRTKSQPSSTGFDIGRVFRLDYASMNWTYSFSLAGAREHTRSNPAPKTTASTSETPGTGVSYTVTPSSALSLFRSEHDAPDCGPTRKR